MAANGINGCAQDLQWKVGLLSNAGKYVTAESFGFKINVSGTSLKKKQTFILEQDPVEEVIYIRSHTGRYLSADKYGNLTCEAEERGATEKFAVEYEKTGNGKWAFKNVAHGNYLQENDGFAKCFAKNVTENETWIVQLSIHPQVNLKNLNRKRYAHLNDDELQVTEVIPWGQDALVILHFAHGKYALKTCDNRYLNNDGTLGQELNDNNKYTLELRSGSNSGIAFRDCNGVYLTAVGSTATMKGRNKTVTKDELFMMEDSSPQVVLINKQNNKKVSTRQGVDVTANQDGDDTDREIFQMELLNPATDENEAVWCFRTVDNTYWCQESLGGIQATVKTTTNPATHFAVDWLGDGTIALKANNGNYVQSKSTGQLVGSSSSVTDKEKFVVRIINRPILLLKNEHGFVGLKGAGGSPNEVTCSKSNYENIYLQPSGDGHSYLKGGNGKYWSVQDDGSIVADSDSPVPFLLEPRGSSTLTIKAPNACYIKGEHNGLFKAVGNEVDSSMVWEF